MQISRKKICLFLSLFFMAINICSQENLQTPSFFEPADSFNQKRFNLAISAAAVGYTGFSVALYNTWYKQYDRSSFHFFNDGGEWNNMDKAGHIYTAYFQSVICFKAAKWTGLNESKAILIGSICGSLFQSTIEMMDGFSTEWGFSVWDFGSNVLGVSSFALQQKYWGEQKFSFKVSSWPKSYASTPILSTDGMNTTSFKQRADSLFGNSYPEKFLKDYNAQTIWVSANIKSLFPKLKKIPSWLNIAFGYGSENMYGGFENKWESEGAHYELSPSNFPRYRQYYLSLDLDLTRIQTTSPFLKTIFSVFNIFKMPAPAIEYTSTGEFRFHLIFL
jgi:hypothetical protein